MRLCDIRIIKKVEHCYYLRIAQFIIKISCNEIVLIFKWLETLVKRNLHKA